MDADRRQGLIAAYADGYHVVAEALDGITDPELDARSMRDDWTAREIVHHLADSEMTSAIRLRRLLVEDRPVIAAYDEAAFARRLHYDRPIGSSLAAFKAARETTTEILGRLTTADWTREGTHSESGPYSVDDWLDLYSAHAHDHAEQIRRARASTG